VDPTVGQALVKARKESGAARDTHSLKRTELETYQDMERNRTSEHSLHPPHAKRRSTGCHQD